MPIARHLHPSFSLPLRRDALKKTLKAQDYWENVVSLHHRNQLAKRNVMSTATLTSLLDYLYGTLSPNNMRWVGEHLIEYAKKEENEQLRPYTMQEIDEMLDEAEAAFEAGEYLTNDEVFHHKEKVSV